MRAAGSAPPALDNAPNNLPAALDYARRGLPVFPLHTPDAAGRCSCRRECGRDNGKHPRTLDGLKSASTDPDQIRRWWGLWPAANIGLATGAGAGCFVLDVDPDAGGWDALDALEAEHGPMPAETPSASTGGGGLHLYFQHPGGHLPNSAGKLGAGLDIRGDGGYVVAPPSRHHSGWWYTWAEGYAPDRAPLSPAPAWLLARLAGPDKTGQNRPALADGEPIRDGTRNATLTSWAGSMRRRGMSEGAILAALLHENATRCVPPLDPAEVEKIAGSVARYAPATDTTPAARLTLPSGAVLRLGNGGPRHGR